MHARQTSCHFNPLPPHGGRPDGIQTQAPPYHFNPLPPHGGRLERLINIDTGEEFQSTPSAWRETRPHKMPLRRHSNFNPLPPHGGRPAVQGADAAAAGFQSTPSAWRETPHSIDLRQVCNISIHSLRMEGDCLFAYDCRAYCYFNPLPPHGGRPN